MTKLTEQVDRMSSVSDHELLRRFIDARDEDAFNGLVERHGNTVWRLCRRMMTKNEDAEDVYQAAFVVLSRKAASIHRGEAVGAWLYRVAYRIALKARKAMQGRCTTVPLVEVGREDSPRSQAA